MSTNVQAKVEQFELAHPAGKRAFQISVSRPVNPPEHAKDVPVLFILDADLSFGVAAEIARLNGIHGLAPSAIVVGVGYGASFADMAKLRTADLTPPLSEAGKQALGQLTSFIGDEDGGAEAFLTFLTNTLAPAILARYPEASRTNHILFGHSLGGLFAAYALLTRPQAFCTFLSSSPSLWWDGFAVLSHLPAFTQKLKTLERQPKVFVCVGGQEQDLPTKVPAGVPSMTLEQVQALVTHSRMVDAAAEFAVSLRTAGLSDVTHVCFQDESHGSVIPAAITRGLNLAVPVPE